MTSLFHTENKEVVRVKAKKCDGLMQPEYKKFCLDPQITSFEMLQNLLAKAFDIKGDFTISYVAKDEHSEDVYLSLLSDWDVDAAFLGSSDPCLRLKVDLRPFEEALSDWDIVGPVDIPQPKKSPSYDRSAKIFNAITGTISSQVGRTVSQVQQALGMKIENEDMYKPQKPPMTDAEYRNFLDSDGRLVRPPEFRLSVYCGGVEPSLRRVVWRHLLNVYPNGLTGKERMEYMKRASKKYDKLKRHWKDWLGAGTCSEEINFMINMVKKDVLRTDRTHKFYAGSDDNENVLSLFNVLVTYAVSHPDVSYCQGMSDIASPLLVVQRDEAHTYVCFCALMCRLKSNFLFDGIAMTTKFQHLSDLLQHHDAEFFAYLQMVEASDLFFCYRWLLLEVKREFPFDNALHMLEVMWSSLPPSPPETELALTDKNYDAKRIPASPASPTFGSKENVYSHLRTLRRRASYTGLHSLPSSFKSQSPMSLTTNTESEEIKNRKASFLCSPLEELKYFEELPSFACISESITKLAVETASKIDKSLEIIDTKSDCSRESFTSELTGEENRIDSVNSENSIEVAGRSLQITRNEKDCKKTDVNTTYESTNKNANNVKPVYDKDHNVIEMKSIFYLTLDNTENTCSNQSDFPDLNGLKHEERCSNNLKVLPEISKTNLSIRTATKNSTFYFPLDSNNDCGVCNNDLLKISNRAIEEVHDENSDHDKSRSLNGNVKVSNGSSGRKQDLVIANGDILLDKTSQSSSRSTSPTSANTRFQDSGFTEKAYDINSCEENQNVQSNCNSMSYVKVQDNPIHLPTPDDFGYGNPFLMFLCLTLLLQHRDRIMKNRMDYNDLAIMFDRMVRKHNVHKVLHQAKALYQEYLKDQQERLEESSDFDVSV